MKKLFCKLPPLQWASLLAALIAAALQTMAVLWELEPKGNYFVRGAVLPTLAVILALLSFGLGSAALLLTAKKRKLSVCTPASHRKFHLFPTVGFALALIGLGYDLISKATELWERSNDGSAFLEELLAGKAKLAFLCLPLLLCAVFYCLNWALSKAANPGETVILGFATLAACAILGIHVYFDFSLEINSPLKSFLQATFLCAMMLFTTELRLPLKKPLPKLLWILSCLVITFSSLCAIAAPVAVLTNKRLGERLDLLFYGLFALCMIPVALEHLLSLSAHDLNDPDQTERTDTL